MQFVNPSKYIRLSIINALAPLKVWSNRVPKNVTPTPTTYALIQSLGKQEYAECKTGNEWLVSVDVDFYHLGTLGYDYSTILDDEIQRCLPFIYTITSPNIRIKNVDLEFERDLSFDTATNSINRKVLTFQIWCDYGA